MDDNEDVDLRTMATRMGDARKARAGISLLTPGRSVWRAALDAREQEFRIQESERREHARLLREEEQLKNAIRALRRQQLLLTLSAATQALIVLSGLLVIGWWLMVQVGP